MDPRAELRDMSVEVLAQMGGMALAYVRPIELPGESGYAIFSAEGELLAIAPSRATAFALIREQDLEPVDAH